MSGKRSDEPAAREEGIHRHPHAHGRGALHRHAHHHRKTPEAAPHEHTHGKSLESLTYLCSPVHSLDPRTKICCSAALILVVVLTAPQRLAEFMGLVGVLLLVAIAAGLPLLRILARSALVLPFAGTIAALAPLRGDIGALTPTGLAESYAGGGWILAWGIMSTAWLSALTLVLLASTTTPALLFKALRALKVPDVLVVMLSFLYRYSDALREQVVSMRRALASRGWEVSGMRRLRLFGNLAGHMFIRAYERGERVHSAMVSRGFDGTLPTAEGLSFRAADMLAITVTALTAAALGLYGLSKP